jgi:ribosomal protein L37AE/L43A
MITLECKSMERVLLHLAGGKVGFRNTSIFDKAGSQKDGKSDSEESASASPLCPECGSRRVYRDGWRYLADNFGIQRWHCRSCDYRFSEKPSQKKPEWQLNTPAALKCKRRICANRKEAKNLTAATETKTVGET